MTLENRVLKLEKRILNKSRVARESELVQMEISEKDAIKILEILAESLGYDPDDDK